MIDERIHKIKKYEDAKKKNKNKKKMMKKF